MSPGFCSLICALSYKQILMHTHTLAAGWNLKALSSSQAPVAEGKPAAHSSNPPASSATNGTAQFTPVHPCYKRTFGTSCWCFSSWFVSDSVVSQQSAKRQPEHTHSQGEDVKGKSCKREAKKSSARPLFSQSPVFCLHP